MSNEWHGTTIRTSDIDFEIRTSDNLENEPGMVTIEVKDHTGSLLYQEAALTIDDLKSIQRVTTALVDVYEREASV